MEDVQDVAHGGKTNRQERGQHSRQGKDIGHVVGHRAKGLTPRDGYYFGDLHAEQTKGSKRNQRQGKARDDHAHNDCPSGLLRLSRVHALHQLRNHVLRQERKHRQVQNRDDEERVKNQKILNLDSRA